MRTADGAAADGRDGRDGRDDVTVAAATLGGSPTGEPLRVLLLFGGRSSEHEVSCLSARSVVDALRSSRHDVVCVGITRDGRWTLTDGVPDPPDPPGSPGGRDGGGGRRLPAVPDDGDTVALVRSRKGARLVRFGDTADDACDLGPVDVCFPALHGPHGEDGTVQGLLASVGVPYVGADVASSAVGVDKAKMKSVFTARGLPQTPWRAVRRSTWEADRDGTVAAVTAGLAAPWFTKPARQGSSVGIRRCTSPGELAAGLEEAYAYDRVALVEQGVGGGVGRGVVRELECGVIGNADVVVTRPGETVHSGRGSGRFYDYEAKYLEPVELHCPADVPDAVAATCRRYAEDAYLAIGARGMARVDFFYVEDEPDPDRRVLVNEINTIPGLTAQSMFPPVWAAEGVSWPALVDRLLALALDAARHDGHYAP